MANQGLPVNVDGSWNQGVPYANVGGAWKAMNFAYVNINGTWKQAWANFNVATGGSVTDISNYNGTGQTWRLHQFHGNGTFTVQRSTMPFRVHVGAGNMGGSSSGCCGGCCGPGNFGQNIVKDNVNISVGSHSVTVGGGGGGGPWSASGAIGGYRGGSSSLGGVMSANGNSSYSWVSSNITGSTKKLGYQTWWGNCGDHHGGQPGIAGRVYIAYQIG